MENLVLGLGALMLGPLIVAFTQRVRGAGALIDAFVLLVIVGLVSLHVLPHAIEIVGWPGLVLAVAGFFAPLWIERRLHGHEGEVWTLVVLLALLGLFLHAAVDGLGLSVGSDHVHGAEDHVQGGILSGAIILHRIPVGISIWWIIPRTLGKSVAVWTLAIVALGTLLGFFFGEHLITGGSEVALAGFESFLAGSLLHVVLHAHVPRVPGARLPRWHVASLLGAGAAVLLVGYLALHEGLLAAPASGVGPGQVFLALALESAPALLAAYLLVGLVQVFLPEHWIQGITKGSTSTQALKGVLVGLPLPVCSCGIVPLYRQLIRSGASLAAATAFLIATPELEIAAVLLTVQLIGPEFALARVLAAALLALLVGILMARAARKGPSAPLAQEFEPDACEGGSCGSQSCEAEERPAFGLAARLRKVWHEGFVEMVDHTAAWILVGLGVSALLVPYLDTSFLSQLPFGLDVPLAALLGLPLYVCASGSTPLAAVLIARGLSPGAALAFLLTGPATNLSTFGVLSRLHGRRLALLFALFVLVLACGLGWVLNALLPSLHVRSLPSLEEGHYGIFYWTCLGLLTALFFLSLFRQGTRDFLGQLFTDPTQEDHTH